MTLVGRLVGPASVLRHPSRAANVTLYLHEATFGKWMFHFPLPAYDWATQEARAGHVSIVVDKLGYGQSTHPDGNATCTGAQADMDWQMVKQLRSGTYELPGRKPRRFTRVVLAGHSEGGEEAELEAYSFGDIDGLIIFSWADQDPSVRGLSEGDTEAQTCAISPEPAYPGGPPNYAYYGATPQDWTADYFHNADPKVIAIALKLRDRDPCGNTNSAAQGFLLNGPSVKQIPVPVLLLYPLNDALFDQPIAGQAQYEDYSGALDRTVRFFPGAGHALPLSRQAAAARLTVSDWLGERGLG